jgi:hypothetical protein
MTKLNQNLLDDLLPAFGRVVEISNSEAIKRSVIAELEIAVLSSWSIELEKKAKLDSCIFFEGYLLED